MVNIDQSTINAFKKGHHGAFQIIYDQYKDLLFVIVIAIIKDEEITKDVLQDTWLKVYQQARTLKDANKLQAWLVLIARNTALNYLKKKKDESWQDYYDESRASQEESSLFQTWHANLNDEDNLIIAYKVVYDMPFQDIATWLHRPLSYIYKRYQGAIKTLKKEYEKQNKT
jgi:RNA polymerase sigma-70 factor (ECF subfamily)